MPISRLDIHPTEAFSRRTESPMIPFENSPIARSVQTEYISNPTYGIEKDGLYRILYLPAGKNVVTEGGITRMVPLPVAPLSRGREYGSSLEPVLIESKLGLNKGYKTLGIITLKGMGLRFLEHALSHSYRTGSSGVLGIEESQLDANMGDILFQEGASVGNAIGIIVTSKEAFLEHFEDPKIGGEEGKQYARLMREAWEDEEKEYKKDPDGNIDQYRPSIPAIARITDPERLDPRTFGDVNKLIPIALLTSSAKWLQMEYKINGKEEFLKRYQLPESYIGHLELEITDPYEIDQGKEASERDIQIAKSHAKLLTYMIARNYAICLREGVDTSFAQKDIGNLGKLHDFPLSLNFLVKGESGDMVVDPELPLLKNSFKTLVNDIFLREGSLISRNEMAEVLDEVSKRTGVKIETSEIIEEPSQMKKDESPFKLNF